MKLKLIIKEWRILGAIVISIALIGGAFIRAERSEALAIIPVGGRILNVIDCCNGIGLVVGPPRPGFFLYPWGAPLYPYYNISIPGPNVLGRAIPGGACLDPYTEVPPPCTVPIPVLGTFVMLGTSGL
ncbi:MAG: hypothetical protein AAB415_03265 [Patescibacteria group bacterium]